MDTIEKLSMEAEKCFELAKNCTNNEERTLNIKAALRLKLMQKEFECINSNWNRKIKEFE